MRSQVNNEGVVGAQARAARATMLLMLRESVTAQELMCVTGIRTRNGINYLIDNLSLGYVPIYEIMPGTWAVNRDAIGTLFD
jgi:hypothetical protein